MSKIDAGKLDLDLEEFSLADLLENVTELLSGRVSEKSLNWRVGFPHDIPDHLIGDSLRIRQCVINLVTNAVKFTESGSVTLSAKLENRSDKGILIRFEVEDTGIGIKPDDLVRLFSAFEQADKSTTRKYGGSGLGLALTRKIAQLMGGDAGGESVPGKGSLFWFTVLVLPSLSEEAPSQLATGTEDGGDCDRQIEHNRRSADDRRSGHDRRTSREIRRADDIASTLAQTYGDARILMVEDVDLNREVLLDMLEEAGLIADAAENGSIAVSMASEVSYDLILMDMQMPVMDGISATQAIRKLAGHADTPIIALTANAFANDRNACLQAGMNDFLTKPLVAQDLFSAVHKWLKVCAASRKRAEELHACPVAATVPISGPVQHTAKAVDDAERLRLCLGCIKDIDLARGPAVDAKPARYIKYLQNYEATYRDTVNHLRSLLATGNADEPRRIAHSLRGSSGMLGVIGIQALAAQLEDAIADGSLEAEISPMFIEIEERIAVVLTAIRQLDSV